MDTDWMFNGIIDSEQKQYILLSYFQKLNNNLEEMKVYPMFTELSLHLGNIQTLINQDKILYSDKRLSSYDDEYLISDLKLKDIPVLADDEYEEYRKILKFSHPRLQDYFGITKSIWSIVYDAITVNLKKNKNNIDSKTGFFYYASKDKLYIWKYTVRKSKKTDTQPKTYLKLIHETDDLNLTVNDFILNFLSKDSKVKSHKYPLFEVICNDVFPLEETLIPIFKRKVMSYISQTVKKEESKVKKLITDGV